MFLILCCIMEFLPVRGMKDMYDLEMKKFQHLVNTAVQVGQKYGYSVIETPILEKTNLFTRSIGTDTDIVSKEMYTFDDRNGESLTLRPEGTAGVVRAIVSNNIINTRNVKYMYYGPMFRYDRPQKGRYRQFHQIGFESIGATSEYEDALSIAMAVDILNKVQIFDFYVSVNSLGDDETRKIYCQKIVEYFEKYQNDLSYESKHRLISNPMRILDSKNETDQKIAQNAPKLFDFLTNNARKYFERVCDLLAVYSINFKIDQFLVRGLDYYCHTAFELKSTSDTGGSIGGGGRYDKLVEQLGGPAVSGVGFAYGAERVMSLMSDVEENTKKVAVVPVSDNENLDAFKILQKLHNADISAEIFTNGSISKRMKAADKAMCDVAFILGEDELKQDKITVKFMKNTEIKKSDEQINIATIVEYAKNLDSI